MDFNPTLHEIKAKVSSLLLFELKFYLQSNVKVPNGKKETLLYKNFQY